MIWLFPWPLSLFTHLLRFTHRGKGRRRARRRDRESTWIFPCNGWTIDFEIQSRGKCDRALRTRKYNFSNWFLLQWRTLWDCVYECRVHCFLFGHDYKETYKWIEISFVFTKGLSWASRIITTAAATTVTVEINFTLSLLADGCDLIISHNFKCGIGRM